MRKKLSVVLATFNEEKNLGACLKSLEDIADEIVIVDGTSTDKTVEIAKEFGARIKVTTNKANFHINKQMAIDMAKCDWILQMDADEHVSSEMKKEIREILENDPKEFNGYWIPRKNYFLGRFLMKGGQYPDYTLRLYRKGHGRLPMKDVHEQAVVDGEVGYLKTALLHYPYESFGHYVRKWDKYNDFFANQIKEEQSKKNIFQKLYSGIDYLFIKPIFWFFWTYFRHKGFVDSWQGATFSFFSAIRFPVSYIKYIGGFKFSVYLILILAIILRFYNFNSRWGLSGDDARDAMVALEALRRHQLPLMGPFSSAGQFVFGGIYYWLIMLSYIVLPFLISAPWVLFGIIGVATVLFAALMGKEIGGKKLGIIVGLFAATSPQLVDRSLILGPHTLISTCAILMTLSFLLLFRTKKKIHAFLLGIFLGLAFSFHYQAINLFIFLPAILFINTLKIKDRIIALIVAIMGFIIPSIPLFFWDSHQAFANIRNIADYILIAQYRIYVPNSWKIFLLKALPGYWSFVIGRYPIFALLMFVSSFALFVYQSVKRKIPYKFFILGVIFSVLLVVNRFYHGERSEGYLLYFVPFILLFVGWFSETLLEYKNGLIRVVGWAFLFLVIIFNLTADISFVNYRSPVLPFTELAHRLYSKFPDAKFSIYDYKYKMYADSMPLSLITTFDRKQDLNGKKLGLICVSKCKENSPSLVVDIVPIKDISNSFNNKDRDGRIWINVNQQSAYDDLIGWLNQDQLKSTFDPVNYISSKIKIR